MQMYAVFICNIWMLKTLLGLMFQSRIERIFQNFCNFIFSRNTYSSRSIVSFLFYSCFVLKLRDSRSKREKESLQSYKHEYGTIYLHPPFNHRQPSSSGRHLIPTGACGTVCCRASCRRRHWLFSGNAWRPISSIVPLPIARSPRAVTSSFGTLQSFFLLTYLLS